MQINIRTSEANQEIVRKLTAKLPTGTKENVVATASSSSAFNKIKKYG